MPELEWRYAYLFFWIVVLVVLIAMVAWFKKKRWF
jgi:magnesium transporter